MAKAPKAPYELQLIQEASDLAIAAFEEVVKYIRPGVTEKEVIGYAEGYLRAHGAEDLLILSRGEYPMPLLTVQPSAALKRTICLCFQWRLPECTATGHRSSGPSSFPEGSHREAYEVLCQVKEAIQAGVGEIPPRQPHLRCR